MERVVDNRIRSAAPQRTGDVPETVAAEAVAATVAKGQASRVVDVMRHISALEAGLIARKAGPAALPAQLAQGVESLGANDVTGVDVHFDSPVAASNGASAYAQGGAIHVAPGIDSTMVHEAWHVVQQAQGRVNPTMQRRADSDPASAAGGDVDAGLESQIRASSGQPLGAEIRTRMESGFGTDFSAVRVHQNSDAAPRIGALAFTTGTDVHFAPGQYDPGSTGGQELLAHELTHVVQQSGSGS